MMPILIFWLVFAVLSAGVLFDDFQTCRDSDKAHRYWPNLLSAYLLGIVFGPLPFFWECGSEFGFPCFRWW